MHKKVKFFATYINIFGVYRKAHTQVKYKSSVMDGLKILVEEIQTQKILFAETEELSFIQQSVQQNCFFAHPENLIQAILSDLNKSCAND